MLNDDQLNFSYLNYSIRILKVEDVNQQYVDWLHDDEVVKNLDVRGQKHTIESLRGYVKGFENDSTRFLFGVFDSETGDHIGNASIYNINSKSKTFDIGYFIGEKEYWGKNSGKATCVLLLKVAFDALQLRKIFTYVMKGNMSSRFILKNLQFDQEAVLKEYRLMEDGTYADVVIYALNSEQWKSKVLKKLEII